MATDASVAADEEAEGVGEGVGSAMAPALGEGVAAPLLPEPGAPPALVLDRRSLTMVRPGGGLSPHGD